MGDEIKTDRLALRPLQESDAAAVADFAGDIEVARMTARIPHPCTIEDATAWIAGLAGTDEAVFAILLDDTLIGCTGYCPVEETRAEIGYWIGKPWWGRGYATEAARALVGHAFEQGAFEVLVSGHFADNPASARVLEKLGFQYIHDKQQACLARGGDVTCKEFRMARPDRDPAAARVLS